MSAFALKLPLSTALTLPRHATPVKSSLRQPPAGLGDIAKEDEPTMDNEPIQFVHRGLESQKARIVAQMVPESCEPGAEGKGTALPAMSRARTGSTHALWDGRFGASGGTSTMTSGADGRKWGNSCLPGGLTKPMDQPRKPSTVKPRAPSPERLHAAAGPSKDHTHPDSPEPRRGLSSGLRGKRPHIRDDQQDIRPSIGCT